MTDKRKKGANPAPTNEDDALMQVISTINLYILKFPFLSLLNNLYEPHILLNLILTLKRPLFNYIFFITLIPFIKNGGS